MKPTLAECRRRLLPGTVVTCVEFIDKHGAPLRHKYLGVPRTVYGCSKTLLSLSPPGGGERSYLDWPGAADFLYDPASSAFRVFNQDGSVLVYKIGE